MSGPPTKKKTAAAEPAPPSPIIFRAAGMKCDTRLMVFRQEFQVHSVVLKLHSAFFRKFMDSPEKQDYVSQDGFRYNWVTSMDEDTDANDWHLVSTKDYAKQDSFEKSEGKTYHAHQNHFRELLCAFYVKPYVLRNIDQLSELTKLADYYCCLRILSNTVGGAILAAQNAEIWYDEMEKNMDRVLEIATKLRNPMLFRDALIFRVSIWDGQCCYQGDNQKLEKIVEHAHNRMAMLVARAHQGCVRYMPDMRHVIYACAKEIKYDYGQTTVPRYFRLIAEHEDSSVNFEDIDGLNEVLTCNLAFQVEDYKAGSEQQEARFFCATIPDDELPWDINDEDY